jgi:hypothetical protein
MLETIDLIENILHFPPIFSKYVFIRSVFTTAYYKLKLIFLIFFGLNTLNFPYISEELTDKYHLRKSILACMRYYCIYNILTSNMSHIKILVNWIIIQYYALSIFDWESSSKQGIAKLSSSIFNSSF